MSRRGATVVIWQSKPGRLHVAMRKLLVAVPIVAFLGSAVVAGLPGRAAADVSASPDVAVDLSGALVLDREVAIDDLGGSILIEGFGGLPDGASVDAYHDEGGGAVLFSSDATVSLPGGVVAAPEDVVRHSGGVFAIEFDGSAEGVPAGANVDGVARDGSGDLVLSFDVTVSVGGVVAADEDLVRFDGAAFALALDTSALALASPFDPALDVDAVDVHSGGVFALSFDTSGSAGGVDFDDEDVLLLDPDAPRVAMGFDASSVHAGWRAADLDAVVLPEPGVLAGVSAGGFLLTLLTRSRAQPRRAAPMGTFQTSCRLG